MTVLSFIACRMFEDEIAHIIENDPGIGKIIVVDNEDRGGLTGKLDAVGCTYELLPLFSIPPKPQNGEGEGLTLIVYMLELALHARPDNLKKVVYDKTEELSRYADGILLFYGLCGNVLGKIEEDFSSSPCIVRILKEDNGTVVDDCIGAVLGGRAAYLEKLTGSRGVGTFFMTPMWAAHWREMVVSAGMTQDPNDIKMSKFVFDHAGYKNVARMDTGLYYEKDFDFMVEEFARLFEFNIIEMRASPALVEDCYSKMCADLRS
ncbi:MAG: DUF1638 domain-containing protein [Methanolobus sp.]|uniref:DUF1638 domain-containing protein n=1 Tax=Methanolobus sp. TaxID=1874737 RepID=UPI00272F653B|nr:DUF1638 domain-containing protein [Methanolobus sp.]MDP2216399.1 DUF1638 domain-containing protein [Methanolobus sp.]